MFKIKCRCGKSEKSFKKQIGQFYIDECCTAAGYDHEGNKEGEDTPRAPDETGGTNTEEQNAINQLLNDPFSSDPKVEDTSTAPETGEVNDQSPPDETEVTKPTPLLDDMTLNELKDMAKEMKLNNFKSLRKKADLIALIQKAKESNE